VLDEAEDRWGGALPRECIHDGAGIGRARRNPRCSTRVARAAVQAACASSSTGLRTTVCVAQTWPCPPGRLMGASATANAARTWVGGGPHSWALRLHALKAVQEGEALGDRPRHLGGPMNAAKYQEMHDSTSDADQESEAPNDRDALPL
jgi:hypothetical protein